MTRSDVGALVVRLFAIVILVHTIPGLPSVAKLLGYPALSMGGIVVQLVTFVVYATLAVLLWTGAAWIGRRLAGHNAEDVVPYRSSADDLQIAALVAIGALFLLLAVTSLVGQLSLAAHTNTVFTISRLREESLVIDAVRSLLAAALIVGARPLVSLTRRLQEPPK